MTAKQPNALKIAKALEEQGLSDDDRDAAKLLRTQHATITAQAARIAELERDAARVWTIFLGLTFDGHGWWLPEWCIKEGATAPTFENLKSQLEIERAAIDAAMQQGERNEPNT